MRVNIVSILASTKRGRGTSSKPAPSGTQIALAIEPGLPSLYKPSQCPTCYRQCDWTLRGLCGQRPCRIRWCSEIWGPDGAGLEEVPRPRLAAQAPLVAWAM